MKNKTIFNITVTRPVAITMIILAVAVFGFVSYKQLKMNLMPNITYPTITIRTEMEGSAPEEIENNVTKRIEEALAVVNNLKRISSVSRTGVSDVILEFYWGTNINTAVQDIREKLDQVFLPEEAKKPVILRYDPTLDPICVFAITSDKMNLMDLRTFCDEQLKPALDKLKGVAAAKVRGGLEEEIRVEIDQKKLENLNLNINRINTRLANENINLAGGILREGSTEYIVRTVNQFKNLDEIRNLIIGRFNNADVRLKDIGTVKKTYKDREVITRVNGKECVLLEIYKEGGANIVQVANRVKKQLLSDKGKTVYSRFKGLINVSLLSDQSVFIKKAIDEVKSNAVIGGILAILVLFLFLKNLKSTFIVSLTIPLSIITTFALMNFFNVTLNIMSLGGIALGVGMLVDNAIVVLESIFRVSEQRGDSEESVVIGVQEVGTAVVASTLTTVAVFFPIVFIEGIAGQIFKDMSLTVVFALLASLVLALFFIPMVASRRFGLKADKKDLNVKQMLFTFYSVKSFAEDLSNAKGLKRYVFFLFILIKFIIYFILEIVGKVIVGIYLILLGIVFVSAKIYNFLDKNFLSKIVGGFNSGFSWFQKKFYPSILDWSLENKIAVLLIIILAFVITYFSFKSLDVELLPNMHQGEFSAVITMPIGTPVEEIDSRLLPFIKKISKIKEVKTVFVKSGVESDSYPKSYEGENIANVGIILKPSKNLIKTEEYVINRVRKVLADIPDAEVRIRFPELFTTKPPVQVEIHTYNLDELKKYTMLVYENIKDLPELKDVQTNIKPGNPEIEIRFDRDKLARLNLNVRDVADLVKNEILGNIPTKFVKEDRRIDIRVRLKDSIHKSINELKNLIINPGGQKPIPLKSVAKFSIQEGPGEIRRIDQQRVGLITANIQGIGLKNVTNKIERIVNNLNLPENVTVMMGGQQMEMEKSSSSLYLALLLSVFLVYIVMASQFESLIHPLIIMVTIPLALFGVGVTLYAFNIPLSVLVFIGMMMLAGIVVNNAIVLIDYINLLRSRGMALKEAIKEAGIVRLRPIFMTTLTTVLGLLPMVIGFGEGSEIRKPMAITVIAGLIFSTMLTLIVIPVIYHFVESFREKKEQ
ncbi:hydrophobic/amphiphilic exporter-1, HAE1 family [Thermotomaculum hydrothermale]|uniref:Hydrophobic/amphiphilic exporter-1, HAE1 family n=1 Tax=Thermotomaculum hydrothermale TaxID=981385 RepID=A0A7R6PHJ3_9BACT|nr:efflux RND transporter permease subunit [Thermotomaculum hydrothermale]BBB32724.1 hydrophobic/amphiphilic exporter-1, HAE1 family [Thermotomaculum hydrothermale]